MPNALKKAAAARQKNANPYSLGKALKNGGPIVWLSCLVMGLANIFAGQYIKGLLPHVHTAIGVGDNDNDRILLSHADVAAAPENAVASLKAMAQLHLRPCVDGAISHLIEILDSQFK